MRWSLTVIAAQSPWDADELDYNGSVEKLWIDLEENGFKSDFRLNSGANDGPKEFQGESLRELTEDIRRQVVL